MKKFFICADIHGDQQDSKAVAICLAHHKDFKPDITVVAGDLWDFKCLRKNADRDEQRASLSYDVDAGLEFVSKVKPNVLLRGNHDERLWNMARDGDGLRKDFADQLTKDLSNRLRKLQCRMLPYDARLGVYRIGHLKVVHGYYCGETAPKRHALVYESVCFGHTHGVDSAAIPGICPRVGWAIGALCNLDMDYESSKPGKLRHGHGWAYGLVDEHSGRFHFQQASSLSGRWLIPSDFREYTYE